LVVDRREYNWRLDPVRKGGDLFFDSWPPITAYETGTSLVIICEIAGMKENDFQVTFEDDRLLIQGERTEVSVAGKTIYHCYEIEYGLFRRELFPRKRVQIDRAEATYENGFLKIDLPLKDEPQEISRSMDPPDFYSTVRQLRSDLNLLFQTIGLEEGFAPPKDIYETEDSLMIVCEIAGMKESDFNITVKDNVLVISGVRQEMPVEKIETYCCLEIENGPFSLNFIVPDYVDTDKIQATYQDGFLRVQIAKSKRSEAISIE
jgi:HSP20 family molecular chaperone IbpA